MKQLEILGLENNNVRTSDYEIDSNGNIDFPVLGTIHIAGLTSQQIAEKIRKEIVSRQLAKDPVVVVDFTNIHYSVLGEVNNPGRYVIDNNRVTLLEALATAGDSFVPDHNRRFDFQIKRISNPFTTNVKEKSDGQSD